MNDEFGEAPLANIAMPPMNSYFPIPLQQQNNGGDPCAHLVHVLLCYHQVTFSIQALLISMIKGGEDPDFVRKAIESLLKKLKDRRVELDALISAVTSGGKQHTPC